MQHLQMKADIIALDQMPPETRNQFEQLNAQAQQMGDEEGKMVMMQSSDLVAQFSAPILSELMIEFTQKIGPPSDEDPLVTIRKQELALKGQELAQEQQQFMLDQNRRKSESLSKIQIDKSRVGVQEDIAEMKDDTARARLEQQKQFKIQELINKNKS